MFLDLNVNNRLKTFKVNNYMKNERWKLIKSLFNKIEASNHFIQDVIQNLNCLCFFCGVAGILMFIFFLYGNSPEIKELH